MDEVEEKVRDQCPNTETLAAFVDGQLGPHEIHELEAHSVRCRACYEVIVSLFKLQEEECAHQEARNEQGA